MRGRLGADDPLHPVRRTIVSVASGGTFLFVAAMLATSPMRGEESATQMIFAVEAFVYALAFALHRRNLALAGALMCLASLGLITLMGFEREGIRSSSVIVGLVCLTFVSALGWSVRGSFIIAACSSVVVALFIHKADPPVDNPAILLLELAFQFFVVPVVAAVTLGALSRSHRTAVGHSTRFEALVRHSPAAMLAIDDNGHVTLVNPQAVQIVGEDAEQCLGRPLAELNWISLEVVGSILRATETIGPDQETSELSFRDTKGRLLELSLAALEEPELDRRWLLSIRDVTERFSAEQARAAVQERIAESKNLEALGRLAGGVAHDFNNLLTIVLGSAEGLKLTTESDDARAELDAIETAAQRGAELTNQLLAFGRKQVLAPTIMCPKAALDRLKPLLKRLLPANIELRIESNGEVGNILVDEGRLDQVILNLVVNGRDAMPQGGTLSVSIGNERADPNETPAAGSHGSVERVTISISDTGEGIPKEALPHIFEPFFSTKEASKGTGLGLATVHGIVAQSGGEIEVQSTVGTGTSFRLCFLGATAPVSQGRGVPEFANEKVAHRILLVEDDPLVRRSVQAMLSAQGHQVVSHSDGALAQEELKSNPGCYQLLVTDLMMPNMDGQTLARWALRAEPTLRVLMISGYAQEGLDPNLMGGRVGFLPKPFIASDLSAMIAELMGRSR